MQTTFLFMEQKFDLDIYVFFTFNQAYGSVKIHIIILFSFLAWIKLFLPEGRELLSPLSLNHAKTQCCVKLLTYKLPA